MILRRQPISICSWNPFTYRLRPAEMFSRVALWCDRNLKVNQVSISKALKDKHCFLWFIPFYTFRKSTQMVSRWPLNTNLWNLFPRFFFSMVQLWLKFPKNKSLQNQKRHLEQKTLSPPSKSLPSFSGDWLLFPSSLSLWKCLTPHFFLFRRIFLFAVFLSFSLFPSRY